MSKNYNGSPSVCNPVARTTCIIHPIAHCNQHLVNKNITFRRRPEMILGSMGAFPSHRFQQSSQEVFCQSSMSSHNILDTRKQKDESLLGEGVLGIGGVGV
jgi:hypothetical protein